MSRPFGMLAAAASLTLSGTVLAQGATTGSAPAAPTPTPQLAITGASAVTSLANWPGLTLSVNQDAFVTVFAVTRTKGAALPIQILSPARPKDAGRLRAGSTIVPRRLLGDEAIHLLNYGESPLIVAFASSVPPQLSAFRAGGNWGHDLLLDTLALTDQQLLEILAKTIYAAGVTFDAVISEPSTLSPVPAISGTFDYGRGPTAFARLGTSINGGLAAKLDPIVMTADVYQYGGMLPIGYANGAPFTLKGGAIAAVERGRLVYLPRTNEPPTADQRAGRTTVGVPQAVPSRDTPNKSTTTPKTGNNAAESTVIRAPGG